MINSIPFIIQDESKQFIISQPAQEFLEGLECQQLGIIIITGKYRTGKSFLINKLFLEKENEKQEFQGFPIAHTIKPCTKGLWLWPQLIKTKNQQFPKMGTIIIDTEGFGGLDEDINNDQKIALLAILLSSYFIYNSVGAIDENALNQLSMAVNLAKDVQIKQMKNCQQNVNEIPQFLWVVRDFCLQLIDQKGNQISQKEYLENALSEQNGISEQIEKKNRIRRVINHVFQQKDCSLFVRPCEDETNLQNLSSFSSEVLRPEFLQQIKITQKKIFNQLKYFLIKIQQMFLKTQSFLREIFKWKNAS